jgi:1-phosphatidylinositol phosphodiesterase
MKKNLLLRLGLTLGTLLSMLLLFALFMLLLPLTESADATPVPGSADWMAKLPDETKLCDVVIPGTHDSATKYVQLAYFSKCQSLSIGEQLEAGFRYLDIRLGDAEKGADCPRLMHGFTNCKRSALGGKLTLDEVLADCCAFLAQHPTETVLFVVKHEHGDSSDAEMAKTLDGIIRARPEFWLVTDAMPTLGEARGRLVLLRRWEGGSGLPFVWADQKGSADVSQNSVREEQGRFALWVQDRFEYGAEDKWAAFTAGLDVPAEAGDVVLSFLSTKGTSAYGHPYQFAEKLNQKLLALDSAKLRGWIVVDYASPGLAAHIYGANFA